MGGGEEEGRGNTQNRRALTVRSPQKQNNVKESEIKDGCTRSRTDTQARGEPQPAGSTGAPPPPTGPAAGPEPPRPSCPSQEEERRVCLPRRPVPRGRGQSSGYGPLKNKQTPSKHRTRRGGEGTNRQEIKKSPQNKQGGRGKGGCECVPPTPRGRAAPAG